MSATGTRSAAAARSSSPARRGATARPTPAAHRAPAPHAGRATPPTATPAEPPPAPRDRPATARRRPIRTDGSGRVRIRLDAGPSRTVRLAFAGDPLLLPAHRGTRIRTPASGWVHAHPTSVPAGGLVRFAGHIFGGHIPRRGQGRRAPGARRQRLAHLRHRPREPPRRLPPRPPLRRRVRRPDLLGPPADPPGGRLPVRARHRPSDPHPCQVTMRTEHRALCAVSSRPGACFPRSSPRQCDVARREATPGPPGWLKRRVARWRQGFRIDGRGGRRRWSTRASRTSSPAMSAR